ncbi:MAG TPA: hypothetical protein PL137_00560 [Nocardioides sp.]|nr:hypothetical protein [Nocardioides sp.]
MTDCRYDRETGAYLSPDGETCDVPRREHCSARKTCSQHLAWGELTCARCLGRTRTDIRQIVERAALMLPEALVAGVDSEAANLAGPAADVEAWSWRKVAAKQGRSWHLSEVEDDDEHHPVTVLGVWARMIAEDYELDCPNLSNLSACAAFLERNLHRIANDENQDFRLMRDEIRRCRSHLESVLHDSLTPERGAPCPTCKDRGQFVRLQREFPHWCDDPDCAQQFHFTTDEADIWACPANREHWWTAAGYAEYLDERMGA